MVGVVLRAGYNSAGRVEVWGAEVWRGRIRLL
jgi:hypothetical protein